MISRIVLLAIVVLWASCSSQSEYANVIPKDASMVMSLDLESMGGKSGLSADEAEKLVSRLTDNLIRRPSESGLSFTDKVYLFVTPQSNTFGIVAKVDDADKVENFLNDLRKEQICTELKSESGCQWTEMGKVLCVFNDDTFLVLGGKRGEAIDHKQTLLYLMRQDAADSYTSTPDYARLSASEGDIASMVNFSFIPNELTMQLRMGVSANLPLKDFKYLLSLTFEEGRIVADTETLIENKELRALYERQMSLLQPIEGTYMECYPANTTMWAGSYINGQGVYDLLCENPTIAQILKNPILPVDVQRIFSSIRGDIAIGYSSITSNDILLYADVTNREFLQTFEDLRPLLALTGGQVQLIDTGTDQYELRMYPLSLWFGVKDGVFYLSNNERLADEAGRRYGVSVQNAPWASEVKGNRFFAAFNVARLTDDLMKYPSLARHFGADATMLNVVLGLCDYITAEAPDWQHGQMNIVMKDKKTNVLEVIARGLQNL